MREFRLVARRRINRTACPECDGKRGIEATRSGVGPRVGHFYGPAGISYRAPYVRRLWGKWRGRPCAGSQGVKSFEVADPREHTRKILHPGCRRSVRRRTWWGGPGVLCADVMWYVRCRGVPVKLSYVCRQIVCCESGFVVLNLCYNRQRRERKGKPNKMQHGNIKTGGSFARFPAAFYDTYLR